jgi:hypothetical protein
MSGHRPDTNLIGMSTIAPLQSWSASHRESCQEQLWTDRVTLDDLFSGFEESRRIFDTLRAAIEALGPTEIRVTKSKVVLRRSKAFACVWVPDRYLRGGQSPLVLTMSFAR